MTKTCRKCGTAFTEALSVCPVCKTAIIQPQAEANAHVTASYEALRGQLELVSLKARMLTSLLFVTLGFLGIGWFYLGFLKRGIIHAVLSTMLLVTAWLFFSPQAFLITLGLFLIQVSLALYYVLNPDAKDARGELLK